MKLAGGAAAVRFAAFAPEEIKRALDHGIGALEGLNSLAQSREGAAEVLPEFGRVAAQSVSSIYNTDTDSKLKKRPRSKNP